VRRALTPIAALVVLVVSVRAGLLMQPGLDYFSDASGAIDALVRLDWGDFVADQPLMGSFSLVLRAPFVAPVFHASLDTVFYAGAVPCLLAVVALGLALGRRLADAGQPQAVQAMVVGLAVVNPLTFRALHWGHPEELLAGALCVGAVLAALRERQVAAGLLLGLALATKQWAVLAVLPVMLATGGRRRTMLALAAGVTGTFMLPLLVGNTDQFRSVATAAAGQDASAALTTPWSIWWPFADLVALPGRGARYLAPDWVPTISHPLIVAVAIPLAAVLWRRRDRRPDDALLLLTLLLLLRCLLDNWNNDYYHAPFLLALLAWETVRRPGAPRVTLGVAVLLGVSFWRQQQGVFAGSVDGAGVTFALYMAWAVPLAVALSVELYRPSVLRRARRWAAARPAYPVAR
jgi:hypothetical protein